MQVTLTHKRIGLASLLLIAVVTAIQIPTHTSQAAVGGRILEGGIATTSFFEGLPVDGRFANGQNPFKEAAAARGCLKGSTATFLIGRMKLFVGIDATVQAQSTCVGCFKNEYFAGSCGQNCNANTLWAIGVNGPCASGDQYVGQIDCGACKVSDFAICNNSAVCHCS